MKGVAMLKYFKYRKINKFFKNTIDELPVKYSSEEDVEKLRNILIQLEEIANSNNILMEKCGNGLSEEEKDILFLKWADSLNIFCAYCNKYAANAFKKVLDQNIEFEPQDLMQYGVIVPSELDSYSKIISNCIIVLKALR